MADETIAATSPASTITKTYEYSPSGERLAQINADSATPANNQTDDYSYDPHQDVQALTNSSGATVDTYGYTAYDANDQSWDTGTDANSNTAAAFPYNDYRFNSARISTTSNNLDVGARTYDPNTDSYLSRDSYNGAGADTGLAADPSNADRYAFAGGNPVSNVEQDGHSWLSTVTGAAKWTLGEAACNAAFDIEAFGAGALGCAAAGGAIGGLSSQASPAPRPGWILLVRRLRQFGSRRCRHGRRYGGCRRRRRRRAQGPDARRGQQPGQQSDRRRRTRPRLGAAGCSTDDSDITEGGESFTADTKVQMADGTAKAISTLKPGDKVKSTDTTTGKTKDSSTSAALVNHDTTCTT